MPKSIWLLIIGMAINVTGASLVWPLNTIYIHDFLGRSLSFAGLVLMLNQGSAIIGNLVGGTIYDKWGGFRSVITGLCISVTSAFLLVAYHSTYSYMMLLMVIGFGSGLVKPAMYAMAGSIWPDGGRKPFNAMYVAQNLGVALGASLGGFIASQSFTLIFLVNGIFYLSFFLLALTTYRRLEGRSVDDGYMYSSVTDYESTIHHKRHFIALLILCSGFVLCWIGYVQWQSTLSSYTQELGISLSHYSILWTINGFLIVSLQPIVKFVVAKMRDEKRQIITGIVIFMISYAVVTQAEQFSGFAAAMVILTIGEVLVWPAVPTLAHRLAPKGRTGFYQGFVNSTGTAGRMLGPLLGGVIVDYFGMNPLFVVIILLYIVAIGSTLLFHRFSQKNLAYNQDVGEFHQS
ncbi:MDR family MFS transporter [Tuberibacillus sp. Marseille-P3662]|uniref:MDR family MFS transporter n=1 Tax=Tuberibacillus sp. Marseille-P3662 TaxID=1965358 RepID=UPI000A1CB34E|nr:MFS transporter [Tuberibacillus sp. Marseille-P3662]